MFSWLIIQGTRAALAYRRQAAAGDVAVIRELVEGAIGSWRSSRRPKSVIPAVWQGIQSMELANVGADFVSVSVQAESEYRQVDGQWLEITSAFEEGLAITAKCVEMLLYELPHVKIGKAEVDVFTSFRDEDGRASRRRIISTVAQRNVAASEVNWDEWTPAQIVESFGGRYRLGKSGRALPIDSEKVGAVPSIGVDGLPMENDGDTVQGA